MTGRTFVRTVRRGLPRIAILTTTVLIILGLSSPAWADSVSVPNSPPVLSGLTSELLMRPDADSSSNTYGSGVSGVYTINLTVSDVDRLADLSTVTICLYRTHEGDPTCSDTAGAHTQDPKNTVQMGWRRSDETFWIDATPGTGASNAPDESWWALGSGSDSAARGENNTAASSNSTPAHSFAQFNPTAAAMNLRFTFRVSEAAREGAWAVRATATDIDNGSDTLNDSTGYSMGWYGAIEAQRSPFDFGEIEAAGFADANDISAGTIQANGGSDVSYSIVDGQFRQGDQTIASSGGTPGTAPESQHVAYDCYADSSFGLGSGPDTSGTRIGEAEREVERGQFVANAPNSAIEEEGTTELPDNRSKQSCRLYVGPDTAKGRYEGTVAVGISQDAS